MSWIVFLVVGAFPLSTFEKWFLSNLNRSGESSLSFFRNRFMVSSMVLPILSLISPSFSLKGNGPLFLSQSSSHLPRPSLSYRSPAETRRNSSKWRRKQRQEATNSIKTQGLIVTVYGTLNWELTITSVSHTVRGYSNVFVLVLLRLFSFFPKPVIILDKLHHLLHLLTHIHTLVFPILVYRQRARAHTGNNLFIINVVP